MKRMTGLLTAIILLAGLNAASATEYFVSTSGDDAADGTARATALRTVGQGLAMLEPGDTLTILPGEYFESNRVELSGTPEAPITIRAERPGTAILRGDVDLRGFERLEGTRYTWFADFDQEVEGVGERDTAASYAFVPSVPEVEDVRGSCYYDPDAGRLYIHTSDSAPASAHALSVSVTNDFGLLIESPPGEDTVHDIVIDGIAATGYRNRDIADRPGGNTRWGIYLVLPERCTIRNCTAFLNGGGIGLVRPKDCLVEDNLAFGNYSTFNSSGGNIVCWTPATDTIQRNNVVHTTKSNGIRFYGSGSENCRMEHNLAWDCAYGEIWIKGGDNETSHMVRNISRGAIYNSGGVAQENLHHNLGKFSANIEDGTNIWFSSIPRFDFDRNFVDPVNHDYRLQSDSPLRGTGPDGTDPGPYQWEGDVFFVSPDGDDSAAGTSVAQAWRTIAHAASVAEPGQTVYLLAGTYNEALRPANSGTAEEPIAFARRGRDRVVLDGQGEMAVGVDLSDRGYVEVEGLRITGFGTGLAASAGEGIAMADCVLVGNQTGASMDGCADVSVEKCLFRGNETAGLSLTDCAAPGAEVASTIFDRNGGPALAVDAASAEALWSDYNAFAPGATISRADNTLDLERWQEATGQDTYSLTHEPQYADADAQDFGLSQDSPLPGRGLLAANIGPYHRDAVEAPLRVEGVEVHSVTDTTANIEWWTPTTEATTELHWGETEACENVIENIFDASIFHTVSLTGLEPGTRYYFRVSATAPATEFHTNVDLARLEEEKQREVATAEVLSFETLAEAPPARTFHVATDGDDSADGLSEASAWRTLRHAAAQVRAGDTVLIHEGTYEEHVPIRATGDEGAPITFRAAPGEKVWLDGSGQKRPTAMTIAFKHHVNVDGLYLRNLRASEYQTRGNAGAIEVFNGSDITITRCFYDGRAETYMPFFVQGHESERLTIGNCVIINGWNGSSFRACPDLTIRHSVFYNGLIRALTIHNTDEEPVHLSHNILCDNIPQKWRNALTYIWHIEALQADYNCYFTRKPADERLVVSWARMDGELLRDEATLPQMRERFGQGEHSIVANPRMPVVDELVAADADRADHNRVEMHREGDEIEPLDFEDFFADPDGPAAEAADGEPMGLVPTAFAR